MISSDLKKVVNKYLAPVAIIIFSLFLRFYPPLDRFGLNMMEIDYLRWIKNLEGYEFLINCVSNHHGFLSPLLLDIWMYIVPAQDPDFYARLLSVLIFTILLILILFLKNDEIDQKARIISAFFLSINGLVLAFSRNARLLTLFMLLTYLIAFYTYKNIRSFNPKNSFLLFLFSTLSFLNHPLSIIYTVAIGLSAFFVTGINRSTFKAMLPIFTAFILVFPYYFWLFRYGKVESELLPLKISTIVKWISLLIDDYQTLIILIIPLFLSVDLKLKYNGNIREISGRVIVRFYTYILASSLVIISSISIFLPLTRTYYIIPLTIFSSILLGIFVSRFDNKVIYTIMVILGIKAVSSQMIFDRQIVEFHSSYGYEKTVLNELRESEQYKSLNLENTLFINLPIYQTRAFDYYRTGGEDYFPKLDKFGYVEEVLNSEYLLQNIGYKNFYLILWDDLGYMADPDQINLYKINMKILDELFTKEQIWEYNFYNKKHIRVYQLTPIQDLAS